MPNATITDTRLHSKQVSSNDIPVVDIAALIAGGDISAITQDFRDILKSIGFLYIKNHGVDEALIARTLALTKDFFALPQAQKEVLNIVHSGQTLRGYIPMYGENVDPTNSKDFKECFDYATHQQQVSPFFGPNFMPEEGEFKAVFEQYHAQMLQLAHKLISVIALSLDLPADYFQRLQQNPITIQRLLHYPPQQGEITTKEIGIGAHTDYGFLTILWQDDNGGLQVMNRDDEWISAPPIAGTFVVNIGDLVETYSNGLYRSTLHRVINTSGKERYSIPFFIDMDFDAVVEVVPTCRDLKSAKTYPSFICGEHKYKRFVDSYQHLQTQ